MNARAGEIGVIGAGIAYLMALGWAIGNVSYDIWGALIVIPVYAVVGLAIVRRMFRGSQRPLATILSWGLLVKLAGTFARYWVGFEAYGGGIDAGRYHEFAAQAAGKVWSGEEGIVTILPRGTGTAFVDNLTAFLYTGTGSSQLAGFITFAFLAYVGTIFLVKAAVTAVPDLAARRYAWLSVLAPSVAYWPSSIGKEAIMLLGLGVATYGLAKLFASGRWLSPLFTIGFGLGLTLLIRPHMAGIWVAAAVPALIISFFGRGRRSEVGTARQRVSKIGLVLILIVAAVGLSLIAGTTIRYLEPGIDDEAGTTDSLTQIIEETTRRTSQAGSSFTPPSVSSPVDWPYAAIRTLTRPLPHEASGVAQLVSALEMTILVGIYAVSWQRLRNLPRLVLTNPYVTFTVVVLFLAGLAYSSFANLGVLGRQKSLIIPFMLLLPCLPERSRSRTDEPKPSGDLGSSIKTTAEGGGFKQLQPSPADGRPANGPWDAATRSDRSVIDELWRT